MVFLKNMSIRGKILSLVMVIVGLELILACSNIYFFSTVNNNLAKIVQFDAKKLRFAAGVKESLLEVHRAQKNSLLFTSRERIELEIARKNLYTAELSTDLAQLDQFMDPRERTAFREMHIYLEEFLSIDRQIERKVLEHLNEGSANPSRLSSAVELSAGTGRTAYNRISGLIDDILKNSEAALDEHHQSSIAYFNFALAVMLVLCGAGIAGGLFIGFMAARAISGNLQAVVNATDAIAGGNLDALITVDSADETGRLAASVRRMQAALLAAARQSADSDYVKSGLTRINDAMRGRVIVKDLCTAVINETAMYAGAQVGAIFLANGGQSQGVLEFSGGYAYDHPGRSADHFQIGEGLVGQAALAKAPICVQHLPADYIKVSSGLGDSRPSCLTVAPLIFEDRVTGVVELAFFQSPGEVQLEYLQQLLPAVAITIETVRGREQLARALSQAQALTEELQQQQDELKAVNEELEEQTNRLMQSEERLRQQQEELETVNTELEEKNAYLENNKALIERSNRQLEQTRLEIEEKAEQLATASRYKSEFLANMSHELRTPLNSILILARMLGDNREGHLTEEQVRSANIIYSSGNDLLALINEVLDLAKIEAGRMELQIEQVDLKDVADGIGTQFGHLAREKGLSLDLHIAQGSPVQVHTDRKRLGQILRNLMSNALKFTESGGITVRIARPEPDEVVPLGLQAENTLAIAIRDTGIGIAPDHQKTIFDAFQQVDSGAARKFPGTGLGLSISRELAHLLGGEIMLRSSPGAGSTFTLYLPEENRPQSEASLATGNPQRPELWPQRHTSAPFQPDATCAPAFTDDRDHIVESDATILVIEDDPTFAQHLMALCRQHTCKVLFAGNGEQGLELAQTYLPKGIFLDIRLPGQDGWSVLESLKGNPKTRHIPVHIVSVEDAAMAALEKGAVGFLTKPVQKEDLDEALRKIQDVFNRPMKELLVVEDDEHLRRSIIALVGNGDVHSDEAGSAAEVIQAIQSKRYDCMILDLGLPDMNGLELLKILEKDSKTALPPVIVYTGRELTREQERDLRRYSESIIIKGVCSEDRLFDEASLFLHRMVDKMPELKRKLITDLHDCDIIFRDKKVLIVDDDMRNVFALSKLLEEKGVIPIKAENGRKALEVLESNGEIDLILMDMMMPVMDGYETMRQIRSQERFQFLPIIALTAKAMTQDRARCVEAGASDYLPKPVDMMRLFSMMRVWLYR